MDLGFSIVSDILFITKHKNDHNFGPNLNIDKILSVLDSPGHSREAKKEQKPLSHKVGIDKGSCRVIWVAVMAVMTGT